MLTMKQLANVLVGYNLRFSSSDARKYCGHDTLYTLLTFNSVIIYVYVKDWYHFDGNTLFAHSRRILNLNITHV